ncbi:serine hydrolase domain-containing protein [Cytobacillus firmus]|uniref:serine hydrolase domain-containing protein n=1 Tax=Cytobacillus firmus TaxID=1399 RepID=UPI00077CA13A|nr:serine hydrolase domain-containing protein [Cytobacillus firmus]MEC1892347.1 serine hydrolase [Cytobacillus firmus]MED4447683.1 serine hydrolase [Cytobacillus firmus]MED4767427.1 serine hydrolase [Cytobacillus firmus]SUV00580.1 putative penicillin-binding protein [Cytobacillus firmus]
MAFLQSSLLKIILVLFLFTSFSYLPENSASAEEDIEAKIEKAIKDYLEDYQVPGASVAIVHNNKLFFSKSWGVTGEIKEEVTEQTPFTIGSISKSLTGMAIMKLADNGTIRLDAGIQEYLPWLKLNNGKAAEITVEQLLTQTSGLSTYDGLALSDKELTGRNAIKNQVKKLSEVGMTAAPGEKHQYSNANFLILGAMLEELTGMSYAEYMEQQIFQPLGMKDASANKEGAYKKGYLSGYQSWFGMPVKSSAAYDDAGAPYGYITASSADMVQFVKLLSGKGPDHFISDKTLDLFMTPQVQTGEDRYYGLGIRISNPDTPKEMIWHSGSTPDSHAEVFYIPETGWGGVILTNKNHILEEEGLYYLKDHIISLLKGDEPEGVPNHSVTIQYIMLGFVLLLVILSIFLGKRFRTRKYLKKGTGLFLGFLFTGLSAALVPLFTFSTSSPWHSISVFAPDIALLTILAIIMLAINGLLLIRIILKKTR